MVPGSVINFAMLLLRLPHMGRWLSPTLLLLDMVSFLLNMCPDWVVPGSLVNLATLLLGLPHLGRRLNPALLLLNMVSFLGSVAEPGQQ